jgi:hypothetical protein
MFMAAYLSPTASGPVLVRVPQVGLSVGGPPVSLLVAAQGNVAPPVSLVGGPHAGLSVGGPLAPLLAAARENVALPVSSLGGVGVQEDPSSGGPVDPGGFSPPHQSSAFSFPGGSSPPLVPPVRTPYMSSYCSLYYDPGGFLVYCPPPTTTFVGSDALAVGDALPLHSAPCLSRWPDLNEEVVHSPPSSHSSLPSSVSFGGRSGDRYEGHFWGCLSEDGYHGGRLSLPSSGGCWRPGLSSPSAGRFGRPTSLA